MIRRQLWSGLLLCCWSLALYAAIPTWEIEPKASVLTFTATQNNAPVTGQFQRFTGNIQFDPADLTSSQVKIDIDLLSLKMGDSQMTTMLESMDWFDVNAFPKATFQSTAFTKTGEKTYQADGALTLRGKTMPVVLHFTLTDYSAHETHVQGDAVIKRSQFSVGQGEWAKTDAIKDDVKIAFSIAAKR